MTNAILEEKGARAALITTRGFRDVLELRRSARANLYDLFQDAPATLIPRRRRFEITERVGADGAVVTPLAEEEIDGLDRGAQGRAGRRGRGRHSCSVSSTRRTSGGSARGCARPCRTCPSICRRMSCPRSRNSSAPARPRFAPMSGPCSPPISGGWKRPRAARALPPLHLMGSNGGILHAAEAIAMPAMAVEFGPAAGVVAAALVARQTGRPDSFFRHGRHHRQGEPDPWRTIRDHPDYEVGGGSSMTRWMTGTGHPIRVPVSILPRCRPEAARSPGWTAQARCASARRAPAPFPARPATAAAATSRPSPTAISARLSRSGLAARRRSRDRSGGGRRGGAHLPRRAARHRGATAAAAVIDVVNNAMAEVLKIVSVQRGHDPRDFVLALSAAQGRCMRRRWRSSSALPK